MEIDLSKPILDLNERLAAENRSLLDEHGVFVLDLMASPGAGKTSTILATIAALRDRYRIAVIEGDIASQGRRREGQGARHPGGADQHGRRVPPRERHDQARHRGARRSTNSTSSSSRTSATSCAPPTSTSARTPRS